MPKDDQIQVRITPELKKKIRRYAEDRGYDDMSKFIIDVITDKIDPVKRSAAVRAELIEVLRDPEFRREFGLR